ncbi:MAG: hypothetical protein CMJ83_10775 [Planctomycetes bacterium]|nr:hypothetical protein [Planctomycetota bacterium]
MEAATGEGVTALDRPPAVSADRIRPVRAPIPGPTVMEGPMDAADDGHLPGAFLADLRVVVLSSQAADSPTLPTYRRCRLSLLLAVAAGFSLGASVPDGPWWTADFGPLAVVVPLRDGVRIDRGVVVIVTDRPIAIEAAEARFVVCRGRVVVTVWDEARVRIVSGGIISGGRRHRAGSHLAWVSGARPSLTPWPRGMRVRGPFDENERTLESGCPGDLRSCLACHERWERAALDRLARLARRGPASGRHLLLALLLEEGTKTQRIWATGVATVGETLLIRDVVRGLRDDPDVEVRDAARRALVRTGVDGAPHPTVPGESRLSEVQVNHAKGRAGLRARIVGALDSPHRPRSDVLLTSWAARGWRPLDLEAALQRGVPADMAPDARTEWEIQTARGGPELLAHPDVITFAREFSRRRWHAAAHLVAALRSHDWRRRRQALASVARCRTRAVLDALLSRLQTAGEGEVAALSSTIEVVLGRHVGRDAIAALGRRHATLLFGQTLKPVFQPPGEDLLLP